MSATKTVVSGSMATGILVVNGSYQKAIVPIQIKIFTEVPSNSYNKLTKTQEISISTTIWMRRHTLRI